ncbi:hypothetical protein THAOC_20951 [Thalassiosira oceanica]|uniref:Uncharacterized protein n=1 Tax=Thalassiosira oceanica TaxID=159749 RepID=K0SD65_THAOC|nr:hypothetical protein THAOC_20951 [Thalassiosira oceanica]|eukprot:EJK58891.1 hypothetical protein THAOC_20951 [Thalassiosira oceanica]
MAPATSGADTPQPLSVVGIYPLHCAPRANWSWNLFAFSDKAVVNWVCSFYSSSTVQQGPLRFPFGLSSTQFPFFVPQIRLILTDGAAKPFYYYVSRVLADVVAGFGALGRVLAAVTSVRAAMPRSGGLTNVTMLTQFPTSELRAPLSAVQALKKMIRDHSLHKRDFDWKRYRMPHSPESIFPTADRPTETIASPARGRMRTGADGAFRETSTGAGGTAVETHTPGRRVVAATRPDRPRVSFPPSVAAGQRQRQALGSATMGTFFSADRHVLAPTLRDKYSNEFFKQGVASPRGLPRSQTLIFLRWPRDDQNVQLEFMKASNGRVKFINHSSLWNLRTGNPGRPGFIEDTLFCDSHGNPIANFHIGAPAASFAATYRPVSPQQPRVPARSTTQRPEVVQGPSFSARLLQNWSAPSAPPRGEIPDSRRLGLNCPAEACGVGPSSVLSRGCLDPVTGTLVLPSRAELYNDFPRSADHIYGTTETFEIVRFPPRQAAMPWSGDARRA